VFYIVEYFAGGKPETKSDSMLVWAAHHDPEIDKRSMCQIADLGFCYVHVGEECCWSVVLPCDINYSVWE